MVVHAHAHPNIALVKYWGKRDTVLNLPAVGSISLTLGALNSHVEIAQALTGQDQVRLDGKPVPPESAGRILDFLEIFRARAKRREPLRIDARNDFPTAAGLASSASGFAALAMALARFFDLSLTSEQLSVLARRGSGSAARSLHGGFVEWRHGCREDGTDSIAVALAPADWWDLGVHVAVMSEGPKAVSSRIGMLRSATTSPVFPTFVARQEEDLAQARTAVQNRDFESLAEVSERSCLRMAATWLTSSPPLHYWLPETYHLVRTIPEWRRQGLEVFFTTDAGPHVKVICTRRHVDQVRERLQSCKDVRRVLTSAIGGPAEVEVMPW